MSDKKNILRACKFNSFRLSKNNAVKDSSAVEQHVRRLVEPCPLIMDNPTRFDFKRLWVKSLF